MSKTINNTVVNNNNMEGLTMMNLNEEMMINEVVMMEDLTMTYINTYVAPIIPENVMAGNNYKGRKTAVKLNGCIVKPWDKSQMKYNSFPQARVPMVAHKFNRAGSEAYLEFCKANRPVSTAQAALDRMKVDATMNHATALHKALWKQLFNCPQRVVLHANKTKNYVMAIIKFCLTHGIDVTYFDEYSDKKWEFTAVTNEFLNPLNQDFVVENETERLELTKARNSVKDAMWRKVEAELAPMTNLAYINRLEHNEEDYLYAQRATLRDIINQAVDILGYDFTAERVMWDESFQFRILTAVRRYGKAYGLDSLITTPFEFTNESFTVYDPQFKMDRPGYAGNEEDPYEAKILAEAIAKAGVEKEKPEISRFVFKANRERKMKAKRDVNWIDVVNQYIQIAYFEMNGGLKEFGLPEYQYCAKCGAPVHEDSEHCELCGTAPSKTELKYAGLFHDCVEVLAEREDFDICPLEEVSDNWDIGYKVNKPNTQVKLTGEQYELDEVVSYNIYLKAEQTRERLSKINDYSPKTCGLPVQARGDEDWWKINLADINRVL